MFVYRFLDEKKNIIYIGKTDNLKRRMREHETNGHLSKKAYSETKTVEYIKFNSEIDQYLGEILLINKYRPKYNSSYLSKGKCSIETNILENWKIYSHNGECIEEIEDRIDKIKWELNKHQSELMEVKRILEQKEKLEKELEETEKKLLIKKNNPYHMKKKNFTLNSIEELEDGWYKSDIYNEIRQEDITVIKEKGDIQSIYIGLDKKTDKNNNMTERMDFYTELIKIEKLLLDWQRI